MRKFFWSLFEFIESVTVAIVLVFLVRYFIAQPFLVSGSSMEPNFENGDYLLVDELAYRFREPERGEVVVFRYPGDRRVYYIKRIIGLPGERVVINEGKVEIYKDGEEMILNEPYVLKMDTREKTDVTLGPGQYFVMGDNRNFSFDSRRWGSLSEGDIIGLARLRLWPVNKVMAFSAPEY
ncbi:MAG TPA: signal peptidase I [Candidatus Paceibacterota bacterium]|nr:signal peptidase I [Candidatus Paceibacterota bacterium]